jgi:hypothetical protein
MTHSIERTSPIGGDFLGTCILCGATNLRMTDALKECPNPDKIKPIDALLMAIDGPEKKKEED